jgi:hypothetical protein
VTGMTLGVVLLGKGIGCAPASGALPALVSLPRPEGAAIRMTRGRAAGPDAAPRAAGAGSPHAEDGEA